MPENLFWLKKTLQTLRLKKLLNATGIYVSYWLSRIFNVNWHLGYPISISVEPTTTCNLKCPECPSGLNQFSRPKGNMTTNTLEKIINEFGKYLFYVTLYFQGEPFINKDFFSFVSLLKDKNIIVGTSTNGHFLNEEIALKIISSKLDRLIVSLDGTDAETYQKYRKGGDFNRVVGNIKRLVELKKEKKSQSPFVELQFIVFKHNEHQIEEVKKLGKELGVNKVCIKTAQLYEFEQGNELMPGKLKYSRYKEVEEGKYRLKNKLSNYCFRMWSAAVITWDGSLVPCCFDKDAEHNFGNITETDYPTIKGNKHYIAFRKQILKDRSKIEICKNCTES